MAPFRSEAQQWIARATNIAPQNLRATKMSGATSSTLWLLHDANCEKRHFVLRIFDKRSWLEAEPDLPQHEMSALTEAQRAGINAPEPIGICEDNTLFGAPVVLMSHLNGQAQLQPTNLEIWLDELAKTLAKLHEYRAPDFAWQFRSWVEPKYLAVPSWTQIPQVWQRALEFWQRGAPTYEPVFIHRDYHPLNVLWQNQTLCGVVDWPNACRGPALADVAHCRSNLMQLFSTQTADNFLCKYLQHSATEYQPFWDVDEILNFCLPHPEWYRPWSEFGVPILSDEILQNRADAFLQSVMARV